MLEKMTAADIMSKVVATTEPTARLSDVLGKLKKYKLAELPVVSGKRLVGLVNAAQLMRRGKLSANTLVKHLMIHPPAVSEQASLLELADIMLSHDFRTVPVTARKNLCGIVTRAALLNAFRGIDTVARLPVAMFMTHEPICVHENETLSRAKDLMRNSNLRALPVIKKGKLAGVLLFTQLSTYIDLARKSTSAGELAGEKVAVAVEVKSVMSAPVSVSRGKTLRDVLDLMAKHKCEAVIVVDSQERPVGVVTETDVLSAAVKLRKRAEVYVQLTGLEQDEPSVYDAIYEVVQKYLTKISRVAQPQLLLLHFSRLRHERELNRYCIRGKLFTPKHVFRSSVVSWELLEAVTEAMATLEMQARRAKKLKKTAKRKSVAHIGALLKGQR
jgi:CBS domain-containing protein/ribosome-associated translation inhibitor RaiA